MPDLFQLPQVIQIKSGNFGFYLWTNSGTKGIHKGSTWTYRR